MGRRQRVVGGVRAGRHVGRDSQHSAILTHRLRDAISILNPRLPDTIREEAIVEFTRDRSIVEPVAANQQIHDLLRDGWKTTWQDDRGELQDFTVRFIDFNDSSKNDFLAVNQFRISGEQNRRADTVLFVNGIPLVLAEFKKPARPVQAAYHENIVDYRTTVPHLFWPNSFVIASNGYDAKMGATYAPWKFFNDWKVIDLTTDEHGQQAEVRGAYALDSLIRGTCRPDRLLDIVENFVAYVDGSGGLTKIVARNHQVIGVNASIEHFHHTRPTGDHRLGVFWHTQGSGKSLSMLWFTQKILRRAPGKWTFVMVTDRTELDDQLSRGFANAGAVVDIDAVRAGSVKHLRELLQGDHRYVFTLIH
jgi:type I restriction enzyme R subunit